MPMEIPKKRMLKKRDGSIPEAAAAPDPAPAMMRVRILRTIRGSRSGTFIAGQAAILPIATARSWISIGFAEEDKMVDQAPEVK
jgi:hypothetical protein